MSKARVFPECVERSAIPFPGSPNAITYTNEDRHLLASSFGTPLKFETTSGTAVGKFVSPGTPNDGGVSWTLLEDPPERVIGGLYANVVIWNAAGDKALRHFLSPKGIISSVALSPDRKSLVFGTWEKMLVCLDYSSGELRWQVQGKTPFSSRLALTEDGRYCVTGGTDKSLRLFEMASGREVHLIGKHDGYIQGLALLPGGQRVVTGSRDKTVRIWDIHNAQLLATLDGHKKEIRALKVTSDGRFAVSAGSDGARVWDLGNLTQIASFHGHGKAIQCVTIAADNRTVATGGEDHHLRIWELPDGSPGILSHLAVPR